MENLPNAEIIDYESMGEKEILENPVTEEVLQRKALEFLKTKDKKWFEREYTGELDAGGYLIDKKGKALTKPWQNIGSMGYVEIIQEVKRELLNDPNFIQPPHGKGLE
jgi:hypothetical protein